MSDVPGSRRMEAVVMHGRCRDTDIARRTEDLSRREISMAGAR